MTTTDFREPAGAATPRPGPHRRRRASRGWALLTLPALTFLAVFFGVPLVAILGKSLNPGGGGASLEAYAAFLTDPVGLKVLVRTVLTAAAIMLLCAVLGYPYAYLMTLVTRRIRIVMMAMVLVPFWTSVMVRTFAWLVLLGDSGPVNAALQTVGLGPLPLVRNLTGVVIGMVHVMLPFMVLPMYATMQAIDRRLVLAGQILGATPRSAFLRIYLPLSLPGVYAGSMVVFILSLGFFVTPAILGSPQEAMLAQLIVARTLQVLDLEAAGAMAGVLLITALAILGLFSKVTRPGTAYSVGVDR